MSEFFLQTKFKTLVPTGPNGDRDRTEMGTRERFAPLRLTGTGREMRNGKQDGDGRCPPALTRLVDRLTHSSIAFLLCLGNSTTNEQIQKITLVKYSSPFSLKKDQIALNAFQAS